MPRPLTPSVQMGFYGKLPARGDFVRHGLPRDFIDPWDQWLDGVLSITRSESGDAWLPAYLEAPVWRFALPAGLCGSRPVLGVTMPSVDKAGRYFPITFAAIPDAPDLDPMTGGDWLDHCEDAGRNSLEFDVAPDRIAADLPDPLLSRAATPTRESHWWTSGSLRLPPRQISLFGLPDHRLFATMLGISGDATMPADAS